jgi:hypothetical protein
MRDSMESAIGKVEENAVEGKKGQRACVSTTGYEGCQKE